MNNLKFIQEINNPIWTIQKLTNQLEQKKKKKKVKLDLKILDQDDNVIWVFGSVVIPLPKKPHPSMRV